MKKLTFENETHWRTSDIQRIVRLAMAEGGADLEEPRVVRVVYTVPKKKGKKGHNNAGTTHIGFYSTSLMKTPRAVAGGERKGEKVQTEVILNLPRRGPKDPHPVAMVALAASHAVKDDIDEKSTLLAFSEVYFTGNYLAYRFAQEAARLYEDENDALLAKESELEAFRREVTPQAWMEPSKFFVAKYKDRLKDATYVDFVKKKRAAIQRASTEITTATKDIASAKNRLAAARRRKAAAEKAIRVSTELRS